ncbi:hypothetical protein COV04_04600 [Candidatus Uhrbacteria bacterium CG10_big_fil_rev_8_21_14_0_10_48_11]|uniref:Ribulose-phosphate 3-epimerase n=1 Tax=Candidatus Uhrbacteria bacterium CG10_big_fil_rev_8_21_14_0_10_48_11 TaxID=1975037 RepID=A0A2M8LDH3_9BACT|nr:MAG: hypothetical protein COV04_04600 [Candidatus Uhrbacteria bacterium CG10_big_fil_rev_8_21_14_0_10_48_11]
MQIIPSILTDSVDDLKTKLASIHGLNLTIQVDFMDGQFVKTRSLQPDDLPQELAGVSWEAHLMVQDPMSWSPPLYRLGCMRLYWHSEVLPEGLALPVHSAHIEHGLALRLETPISIIAPYLANLSSVLLLSIKNPGSQGESFDESVYEKIRQLKALHPRLKVTVDGGVKIEHMKPLTKLGVDRVSVGSAFWKFGDSKTLLAAFRHATL